MNSPDTTPFSDSYRKASTTILVLTLYLVLAPLTILGISRAIGRPLEVCLSLRIFGRPCPLCGMTRAAAALLQGHVTEAVRLHPLALPLALVVAGELAFRLWIIKGSAPPHRLAAAQRIDIATHVTLLTAYVLYITLFYTVLT